MATILIVEDEPQISDVVRSLIEEQGHKVLSAATADEALVILNGPEAVGALFVDIVLEGDMQAGIEFAKRAVELKPDLKVLYSTGLTVTDDMKALVVPGSIILEKPYSEDELLTSLSARLWGQPAALRSGLKLSVWVYPRASRAAPLIRADCNSAMRRSPEPSSPAPNGLQSASMR